MSRSLRKPLNVDQKLEKKCQAANKSGKQITLKVYKRGSVISSSMIGHTFLIHNGKKFISLQVTADHVSYIFGEFSPTRRIGVHGKAGTH